MKQFNVPSIYRSDLISAIKASRRAEDRLKKDFSPTLLDFGQVQIFLARHFGFCYGVENAIEIAFNIIEANPDKQIYLLSEMIHNPQVNADLAARGVKFLQDTYGRQLIGFDQINKEDIVIIPAFGTTLEVEALLHAKGIQTEKYDTTCPFVEKVWNRSEQIAKKGYSIVVHGKPRHEETRATFSHASAKTPTVIVNDMQEAAVLAEFIRGTRPAAEFYELFKGKYAEGFDVTRDLRKLGVVNQTTQLASETQAISDYLKRTIKEHYGLDDSNLADHFADTRDTLCYATNDNQSAVSGMLETAADFAIVVGGYNSSNTSHLVELCAEQLPTYFINHASRILSATEIETCNWRTKQISKVSGYMGVKRPVKILITSGASCPDSIVQEVIYRILELLDCKDKISTVAARFMQGKEKKA